MNILKPLILGIFLTNTAFASDLTFKDFQESKDKNYFFTQVLNNNKLLNSRSCNVIKFKELKKLTDNESYAIQTYCDDNSIWLMSIPKKEEPIETSINCAALAHKSADEINCDITNEEKKSLNKWIYKSSVDEMRDEITNTSILHSDNTFNIEIYGKTPLLMQILNNNDKKYVFLSMEPTFDCHSNCTIFLKFDNKKLEETPVYRTPDGDGLVFEKTNYILDQIKSSKNLIIEVPIFRNGLKQYKFKTEGYKDF